MQPLLAEIIINKIRAEGPLSFHDFMEMALYYPFLGYYSSGSEKIGGKGDYYTSPDVTTLFGEMIALQIEEMWRLSGSGAFAIVEYGAGPGILCRDILRQLEDNEQLYRQLTYCIIEKSSVMRDKERALLGDKVKWISSVNDIKGFTGCVLSNELLDNFSVHEVVMLDGLMEVYIDYADGFREVLRPADAELAAYFSQLGVSLPYGFRTEVNREAIAWLGEIAEAMTKGFVLTIDYGFASDELYSEKRKKGTILCYNKHAVNEMPYNDIGEQDITAHVNFSALRHWGNKYGLDCCGYTDQAGFLHSLGIAEYIRNREKRGKNVADAARSAMLVHRLLLDMGSKFKVLIQQKGVHRPELSGMRLAQQVV